MNQGKSNYQQFLAQIVPWEYIWHAVNEHSYP